jgi:hypothetical protein
MKPEVYEKYVVFNEGDLPQEELLGRCSDYARLALGYYQKGRFVRAIFWAVMASASSSFESAFLAARFGDTPTRASQVERRTS